MNRTKVFKKADLNKVSKEILVKFATALGLTCKTKKAVVDTLAELTFDKQKEYEINNYTLIVTNKNEIIVSRDYNFRLYGCWNSAHCSG